MNTAIKTDLKPLGIKPSSITDMSLAGLKYLANNGTIILNLNEEGNNFSDLIKNRYDAFRYMKGDEIKYSYFC